MVSYRHREETINTQLAILISRHGITAEAETIHLQGQHRPDVLFSLRGLRVVIEGKFAGLPDSKSKVLEDAKNRVDSGVAHIAVAVIYPEGLRTAASSELESVLNKSRLRFKILSEYGEHEDWASGDTAEILGALRRIQETLASDDLVETTAQSLSKCLDQIAQLWVMDEATCDRLSNALGMTPKKHEKPNETEDRRITAAKVAALVLANAMIFQEQLASRGGDGRIDPVRGFLDKPNPIKDLQEDWRWIWTKINYVPIFQLGENILNEIPVSHNALVAIRWLMHEVEKICANQSALRHDLMGRIYHWLLHHAKYLGTYYTATSSATLLLKLTMAKEWESIDFGSPRRLVDFVVSDLACGTGTLLTQLSDLD